MGFEAGTGVCLSLLSKMVLTRVGPLNVVFQDRLLCLPWSCPQCLDTGVPVHLHLSFLRAARSPQDARSVVPLLSLL